MLTWALGASMAHSMATDQHRGLAVAHEVAGDGEDEVAGAVHLRQELVGHLHRDLGPCPTARTAVVEDGRLLRPEPDGLGRYGGDDTIGRPLQQIPDEGASDAEPQHHELADPLVIHQPEMVIGIRIPGSVDAKESGDWITLTGSAELFSQNTPQFMHAYIHKTFGSIPNLFLVAPIPSGTA